MAPPGSDTPLVSPPPSRLSLDRIEVLGMPVDRCTRGQALRVCAAALGPDWTGPSLQVVTLNPEMVMQARRRPELAAAIRSAGLVLADGSGIAWAANRLGRPVPERLPGVDFLQDLCALAASSEAGVFFLGAAPGVAQEAALLMRREHPDLRVAGATSGSAAEEDAAALAASIRSSGATLLAVAFGVPTQELWISRHLAQTGCRIGIGVGGSFDYLSGRVRRAPAMVRRAGLEWSFRLLRQPWRLPRMLRGSAFFWAVMRNPGEGGG